MRCLWVFLGLLDGDALHRDPLKPCVLIQDTLFGNKIRGLISDPLIMPFPFARRGQQRHVLLRIPQEIVLDRMPFLFPTVHLGLFLGISWTGNRTFGAIMERRPGCRLGGLPCGLGPCWEFLRSRQRMIDHAMQEMNPAMRLWLIHPEQGALDILGRRLFQIHQDEQQFVFHRRSRRIPVHPVSASAPRGVLERRRAHGRLKFLDKIRKEGVKFFLSIPRHCQELSRMPG